MEERGKTYNTRELLKADVVELTSGSVVGRVAEAIVNTQLGVVEFLGIRPMCWHEPGLLLNTAEILGFDETVLLIREAGILKAFGGPKLAPHYVTCGEIYGLNLIDTEGRVLGRPVGCVFSASGHIIALEAEKDLVVHFVSLGRIIAVGDRFVVADLMRQAGDAKPAPLQREARPAAEVSASAAPGNGEEDRDWRNNSIGAKYRERQIQLMLGKPSPVTLTAKNGQPVITVGETITGRAINRLIDEELLNDLFIALTVHHGHISIGEPEIKPE